MKILILGATLIVGFVFLFFQDLHRFFSSCSTCNNYNVILISIDTLGAKSLGIYGYERNTSPVLDSFFAERGVVMENAFSAAPWTLPSHAALFASRLPSDLKVESTRDRLPSNILLLPELFRSAGRKTHAISGGLFVSKRWGFDKGFDSFVEIPEWEDANIIFPKAIEWLKRPKKDPFFLFLHIFEPHDTYNVPQPLRTLFDGGSESKPVDIHDIVRVNITRNGWTDQDKKDFIRAYDQEIYFTDSFFEEFFETLEAQGLLKNTIIMIVSDHGEEFGEHGTIGLHGQSLYDELIHVPMLLYVPGVSPGRISAPVSLIDVAPTLLDYINSPIPEEFDGVALREILEGPDSGASRIVLSETVTERNALLSQIEKTYELFPFIKTRIRKEDFSGPRAVAARSKDWKLIKNIYGNLELYNISLDPTESENLIDQLLELSPNDQGAVSALFRALDLGMPT